MRKFLFFHSKKILLKNMKKTAQSIDKKFGTLKIDLHTRLKLRVTPTTSFNSFRILFSFYKLLFTHWFKHDSVCGIKFKVEYDFILSFKKILLKNTKKTAQSIYKKFGDAKDWFYTKDWNCELPQLLVSIHLEFSFLSQNYYFHIDLNMIVCVQNKI